MGDYNIIYYCEFASGRLLQLGHELPHPQTQYFLSVCSNYTLSIAMGKITVFSLDSCPYCKKAKELLRGKGAEFEEISLTKNPEWRQLLYLITNGEMGGDCYYIRKIKFILLYLYDPSRCHTITPSHCHRQDECS